MWRFYLIPKETVKVKSGDVGMEYKKSELTKFAKTCSYGASQMLNGVCVAEGISKSNIGQDLINDDAELLLEVSKRFAKYANDQMSFDVQNGDVQDFQTIIEKIVTCCEDNDWFNNQ